MSHTDKYITRTLFFSLEKETVIYNLTPTQTFCKMHYSIICSIKHYSKARVISELLKRGHNVHKCAVGFGTYKKGSPSFPPSHAARCTLYIPLDGHTGGK